MNNDQKESFFIMERNLESIYPNKDVTVSLKFEKSDYRNVGPSKAEIEALKLYDFFNCKKYRFWTFRVLLKPHNFSLFSPLWIKHQQNFSMNSMKQFL